MPYSFRRASLQKAARVVDLALVGLALLIAMVLSSESLTWPSIENLLLVRVKLVNLFLLAGYLGFCSLVFSSLGFYGPRWRNRWTVRLGTIVGAVILISAALLVGRDPFDLSFATNIFLLVFCVLCSCLLMLVHELSRTMQGIARLHGKNFRNVVIIGDRQRGTALAARIEQQSGLGYRVLKIITPKEPEV
jgi:FlaA1/EpsC-like NDP-sugar epimerase